MSIAQVNFIDGPLPPTGEVINGWRVVPLTPGVTDEVKDNEQK